VSITSSHLDPPDRGVPRVLGVDVGGTRTRAVIASAEGVVLGRGDAPGANRHSSAGRFVDVLTVAIREAQAGAGQSHVHAAVVAVAGMSHAASLEPEVQQVLAAVDIAAPVEIVPDVVANHAAGTDAASGLVLVAGTGAIAAWIDGDRVERRADGVGWLLGDEGSAVWFGVEAVRAVLRAWDGRGAQTALDEVVAQTLLDSDTIPGPAPTSEVIAAVHAESPASLGRLAPDVIAAAEHDEVAADIVDRAIEHLRRSAEAAAGTHRPRSIVLAGSLLLGAPTIAARVVTALRDTWPDLATHEGRDGAAGAAAIALRSLPAVGWSGAVHRRLTQA
jgi:glucosamine kinase